MAKNSKIIVGIDEVGRGPLAGPVLACAITQIVSHSEGVERPKNLKYEMLRFTQHDKKFFCALSEPY